MTSSNAAGAPTLYPADLAQQIEDINAWVYDDVANGAYKAGFTKSQVLSRLAASVLPTCSLRSMSTRNSS